MRTAFATTRPAAFARIAAAAAMLGLLSACAGQGSVEAIYRLEPLRSVPGAAGTRSQILVPEPRALAAIATERIAVKPTASSMSYYQRVAWADTAPRVFQVLLLESLQNTGRVDAVGLPGQSLLIDYQIVTEVRDFHIETYGADQARVSVSVKILNDRNGRVVAARVFDATVPASGDSVDAAVRGIERAAQTVIADIIEWVLATI